MNPLSMTITSASRLGERDEIVQMKALTHRVNAC